MVLTAKELKTEYAMSDAEIAELKKSAQGYESGEWPAGRITKVGRPSIAAEEVRPITVRLPLSQINALDSRAKSKNETRSAAVRAAVDDWLLLEEAQ